MISKYTIAILGVAFFAIAIQAASNPDLKNAVEDLIKELEEKIQNLVNEGIKQFRNALSALIKILDDILSDFLSVADGAIRPIIDEIKKISNEAIAKGINITECAVDDVIAEIENLPELFLDEVQTCIDTVGETANQTIAEGEQELNKIVEKVGELADEAAKCGFIDPVCWARLAEKITSATLEIPGEVTNIISKVIKSMAAINTSAVECQTSNMKKLVSECQSLLQNVTECVNSKSLD